MAELEEAAGFDNLTFRIMRGLVMGPTMLRKVRGGWAAENDRSGLSRGFITLGTNEG